MESTEVPRVRWSHGTEQHLPPSPAAVRQAEVDGGTRAGLTSEERERIKLLERENRELRRANEILKSAAVFFGAELDRRSSR